MKRYNLINNSLGWLVFIIATVTYMMTLEPTASFWDCGEYIAQGYKLEVGHPPGNPIFNLTARFFANFASGPDTVALCVNVMSGLLSAATILLLFWTITHLVRRLTVKDDTEEFTWQQLAVIMGSGVTGALAYAWSDTFWFSAVEAEVYAFSSFCTALTFWLILKWENRSEQPNSDRYLIAIAFVIGVSVAVHLLNLLCIPAIILVIYYKKFKKTTAKGSLLALLLSFAIIVFILYGLVPGFVEIAQYMELLFVNKLGMSFNSGVIFYSVAFAVLLAWTIYEFHTRNNMLRMKLSFLLTVFASGILFLGTSMFTPFLLTAILAAYLFWFCKEKMPVRIFQNIVLYITVIFIGYSSFAIILLRSNAQTPMDQNSPDNVFSLGSYLSREQYGKTPLLYGPVYNAPVKYDETGFAEMKTATKYVKGEKTSPDEPDRYIEIEDDFNSEYVYDPAMCTFFPRLYDSQSEQKYRGAMGTIKTTDVEVETPDGGYTIMQKPTFGENLRYFFQYQLNFMYWRYFMWNFAGRQNDIQGHGEITHGNWISGIPFIDNPRLGDQSKLPAPLGEGNAGHNVFYMLPLLLGLIGLLWQAYSGKRGIEQFWVVFFLFFMTGIAIVIYLNQTPEQPRERDYAYAGSFYAFAIWIGMGVAGVYQLIKAALKKKGEKETNPVFEKVAVAVAVVFGLFVPLQMVSQTWDDHDRSGRTACRDFGMNYLSSVDENGILFTSGDNDTFPLWYAQEVEGWRTDVRVVNLSYLATDWYLRQMQRPAYESAALPMQADNTTYAYNRRQVGILDRNNPSQQAVEVFDAMTQFYKDNAENRIEPDNEKYLAFNFSNLYMPVNKDALVKNGSVKPEYRDMVVDSIAVNLLADPYITRKDGYLLYSHKAKMLDIISSDIKEGWNRPVYFAMTVPDDNYSLFTDYTKLTGMAYQLTPFYVDDISSVGNGYTDKAYDNVTTKFRWGGLDKATPDNYPYYDETAARMVNSNRMAILQIAGDLCYEAEVSGAVSSSADSLSLPASARTEAFRKSRYEKARNLLDLLDKKLPSFAVESNYMIELSVAQLYYQIYDYLKNPADKAKADKCYQRTIDKYADYMVYYDALDPQLLSGLTGEDLYIFLDGGFLNMLTQYHTRNPEGAKAKIEELKKKGANIWNFFTYTINRSADQNNHDARVNAITTFRMLSQLYPKEAEKYLQEHDTQMGILAQHASAAMN